MHNSLSLGSNPGRPTIYKKTKRQNKHKFIWTNSPNLVTYKPMGYTTDFFGHFDVTPTLKEKDRDFLFKLSNTRRMARKVGPEYGVEGEFYVDGGGDYGQNSDSTIIDYNQPPSTQPGLWCQWVPSEDGTKIEWDGGEKFYDYVEWIAYLIDKILSPRGYVLDGEVEWQGEDSVDFGKIVIKNNIIRIKKGKKHYV
jgi:hypothetical protein